MLLLLGMPPQVFRISHASTKQHAQALLAELPHGVPGPTKIVVECENPKLRDRLFSYRLWVGYALREKNISKEVLKRCTSCVDLGPSHQPVCLVRASCTRMNHYCVSSFNKLCWSRHLLGIGRLDVCQTLTPMPSQRIFDHRHNRSSHQQT